MPRAPASLLCVSLMLFACSGTDTTHEHPAADPVEAPAEPEAPEVAEPVPAAPEIPVSECEHDSDCALFSPCCVCPPRVIAVNDAQLQAQRRLCRSARCSPCEEPGQSMDDRMAHCEAGHCAVAEVLQGSISNGPVCESNDDCAVHTRCCECPPRPAVMHVDEIRAIQDSCSRRTCRACELPAEPGPTGAACHQGACVQSL